jgi:hypothetical protein
MSQDSHFTNNFIENSWDSIFLNVIFFPLYSEHSKYSQILRSEETAINIHIRRLRVSEIGS